MREMQEIRILAFDPGPANTGYANLIYDEKNGARLGAMHGVLKSPAGIPDRDRNDLISDQARALMTAFQPTAVGIEDWTYMGKKGKQESTLPALIESLRLTAKYSGFEPYVYTNAEWKKKTLKIGGANKEQIKHYVTMRLKDPAQIVRMPQHVWDAVGVCFAILEDLKN